MLAITMPEAFGPGDSGGCRINTLDQWIAWSADGATITIAPDDHRLVMKVGEVDPLGLRLLVCSDPLHRWRITYRQTGEASIVVEAESAEAAQAKFEAGDATPAEWLASWEETGGGYEIVEVVHVSD